MTIASTTSKLLYNGDGSTTVFAISFIFWDSADLKVIHRDSAGAETEWTEGTHYTVTGGSGSTGSLTVKTTPTDYTPASGEKLLIKSAMSETQDAALPLGGAFPSTTVEQMSDILTRLVQQHSEEIARSILLPETASLSGLRLPEPGAGELVRYNAGGTDLETVAAGDISTAIDSLLTGLADKDFLRWDAGQSAWVNRTPANVRSDLGVGATGDALFAAGTAAAARATLEVASEAELQQQAFAWDATDAGVANDYIADYDPAVAALTDGMLLGFEAANASTGASTFTPANGTIAKKAITKRGAALEADDILVGQHVWLSYDLGNDRWEMVSPWKSPAVFTEYFESSAQTITAAGTYTIAHGLSKKPTMCALVLKCTTADQGYSVGDEVFHDAVDGSGPGQGFALLADATNVGLQFGSNTDPIFLPDYSTGGIGNITKTSWEFYLRAWA